MTSCLDLSSLLFYGVAEKDSDYAPFEKLITVLANPFDERDGMEEYTEPAPGDFPHYRTFCGT